MNPYKITYTPALDIDSYGDIQGSPPVIQVDILIHALPGMDLYRDQAISDVLTNRQLTRRWDLKSVVSLNSDGTHLKMIFLLKD